MPKLAIGETRLAQRLREKAKAASAPPIQKLSLASVRDSRNPERKGKPTGNREMEILFVGRGDPVDHLAEPENETDENAIAVYAKTGVQLGYISVERMLPRG